MVIELYELVPVSVEVAVTDCVPVPVVVEVAVLVGVLLSVVTEV